MAESLTITLRINGKRASVTAAPMKRLLDVLREELTLTGAKEGCGEGECGACSVLLDGEPVNSCLVPFAQCEGRDIRTVEGLAKGRALTALQRSFVEMGGAQCGICTPGMLVAATALLARKPGKVPSESEVRDALAGNLCRCTGYQRIVDAVRAAAREGAAAKRASAKPAKRAARRGPTQAKRAARRGPTQAKRAARRASVMKKSSR